MGEDGVMIRMLGGAEIDGHGPIRSRAQRVMLAALVIDLDRTVSTDSLADRIWGHAQPKNPSASLQNHVSRVRKILPGSSDVISDTGGYRLVVDGSGLDVSEFDGHFESACMLPVENRLAAVEAALALWRGRPFADLDDDLDAAAVTSRLEERHLALGEMRAETLLALGRLREATAELEGLRYANPLREATVEILMNAYIGVGRKSDALAVYRSLQASLLDELGLDPSPRLQRLEMAILSNKEPVCLVRGQDRQGPPSAARLPTPVSTFVGRQQELLRVTELMERHRLVTIVGPGGVGKTRLAAEAAIQGDDESIANWVELSSVEAGSSVGHVVAGAMGLQSRFGTSGAERIIEAVGGRRQLLLLDNCEHLIADVTDLANELVLGAPGLRILATSREPMGIDGERVLRLTPLDIAGDAVDLFIDRARASADDIEFAESDLELVSKICASIDGLPLAIEIAASRCGSTSLGDLAKNVDEPLTLAQRRSRPADDRHSSLAALVDWSAKELDDDLRTVFESASVFAGAFTAEDAAVVIDISAAAASDALRELVERSLITVERRSDAPSAFRFLATIRSYATEQLENRVNAAEVVERYFSWGLQLVESCHRKLIGPQGTRADVRILEAMDDLRVLHRHFVETDDGVRSLRLAATLDYTVLLHMRSEALEWVIEAADRFSSVECSAAEQALTAAVIAAWMSGDLASASTFATNAAEIAARSSEPRAGMWAAQALGDVAQFNGDNETGFMHFKEGVAIAQAAHDRLRSVTSLAETAMAAGYIGRFDTAREMISESLRYLGNDGALAIHAWVRYCEGEALADDDPARALTALTESLRLARISDSPFVSGVAGLTLTSLQIRTGDSIAAIGKIIDLIEQWRATGAWVQQWITMRTVVELLVLVQDYEHAALVLGAVVENESSSEVSGSDAQRLHDALATIEEHLPDARHQIANGAEIERDQLVESVSLWLQGHLTVS